MVCCRSGRDYGKKKKRDFDYGTTYYGNGGNNGDDSTKSQSIDN